MSAHRSLDRESFQALLADAFAVQESGMSKPALSGLIELHKAIAKDELPFERLLDLIADRARIVADATGIAIGLLAGNQLVYGAGSGSGAQYIGQRVTAVLTASAHKGPRKEILRVDNAESDARIEAAICRQHQAKALLIIPIYRHGLVAGALEVFFSDAHTFDDREMRTYRMMATLVEVAMERDLGRRQKSAPTSQPTTTQASAGKTWSRREGFRGKDEPTSNPSVVQVCDPSATAPGTIPALHPPMEEVTTIKWPLKRELLRDSRRISGAAAAGILLGVAGWISLHHDAAVTMENGPRVMSSYASERYAPKPTPNKLLNASGGRQYTNSARVGFKWVKVGPNEMDYVAEDVTIRHFTNPVSPSKALSRYKQFDIGDDVTVRIFNHTPDIALTVGPTQRRRHP
jgi:hypothetical protein